MNNFDLSCIHCEKAVNTDDFKHAHCNRCNTLFHFSCLIERIENYGSTQCPMCFIKLADSKKFCRKSPCTSYNPEYKEEDDFTVIDSDYESDDVYEKETEIFKAHEKIAINLLKRRKDIDLIEKKIAKLGKLLESKKKRAEELESDLEKSTKKFLASKFK